MTMHSAYPLILALAAGMVLGTLFFGGLWWTVRKGVSSKCPALWFLGSWVLRTGVVLAGFYVISDSHWDRLLAALLGFIIARLLVTRRLRLGRREQESGVSRPLA